MHGADEIGSSRRPTGVKEAFRLAARRGLRWGSAGLLLGMLIGAGAGLWLAQIDNALYGIGGDNYSGPLSRTAGQEAWVYLGGLGVGLALGGGLLAVACGVMGCISGIVAVKPARAARSEPE